MTNTVTALNAPITFRAYSAEQIVVLKDEVSDLSTTIETGNLGRDFHSYLSENAKSLATALTQFHSGLEGWSLERVVSLNTLDKTRDEYLAGAPGDEDYKDFWKEIEPNLKSIEEGFASHRLLLRALPSVELPSKLDTYKAQLDADTPASAHDARHAELKKKLEAVSSAIALMRKESLDKLKVPAAEGTAPAPEPLLPPGKQDILQTAVNIILKTTDVIDHVLELKELLLTRKSLLKQQATLVEEAKATNTALHEKLARSNYLEACNRIEQSRQAYIDEVEKVFASLELFCAHQRSPAADVRDQVERLLAQLKPLVEYIEPLQR